MQIDLEGRVEAILNQQEIRTQEELLDLMWDKYARDMEVNIWEQVAPILDDPTDSLKTCALTCKIWHFSNKVQG